MPVARPRPKPIVAGGQSIDPEAVRDGFEINIAASFQGVGIGEEAIGIAVVAFVRRRRGNRMMHVAHTALLEHLAEHAGDPASAAAGDETTVEPQAAGAFDAFVEADDMFAESGQSAQRLDRRSGLKLRHRRPVAQRIVDLIVAQHRIDFIELVEVIGWIGDQGQNLIGLNIEHDAGAVQDGVVFLKIPLGIADVGRREGGLNLTLKLDVDRGADIAALNRTLRRQHGVLAGNAVGLAARAAKGRLAKRFETCFANQIIWQIIAKLVSLDVVLHVLGADAPDMADQVTGNVAIRIGAMRAGAKNQAGIAVDVLGQFILRGCIDGPQDDVRIKLLGDDDLKFIDRRHAFPAVGDPLFPVALDMGVGRSARAFVKDAQSPQFDAIDDRFARFFDVVQRMPGKVGKLGPHIVDVADDRLNLLFAQGDFFFGGQLAPSFTETASQPF